VCMCACAPEGCRSSFLEYAQREAVTPSGALSSHTIVGNVLS